MAARYFRFCETHIVIICLTFSVSIMNVICAGTKNPVGASTECTFHFEVTTRNAENTLLSWRDSILLPIAAKVTKCHPECHPEVQRSAFTHLTALHVERA
eukprot:3563456-Pyramimonas_sp.AAC.1